MTNLTTEEQAIAAEIVYKGLAKAAESLSFFLKESVEVANIDNDTCDVAYNLNIEKKNRTDIHLMTTAIMGEMKGLCCLVFSKEEADLIKKAALPEEIHNDEQAMKEIGEGFLLELDNIISASVITEFANSLETRIFGDVPGLKVLDEDEMFEYLNQQVEEEMFFLNFKANFKSDKVDFAPEFIWMFDNSFAEKVKLLVKQN
jgi:chemotaxis protein CheY-P-specific phosphatase CheC